MSAAALLVELFTEELPPRSLEALSDSFASTLRAALAKSGHLEQGGAVTAFATPRRIAARLTRVLASSPEVEREVQGPPLSAAPAAVAGFARKNGLEPQALARKSTPKGEVYVAHLRSPGAPLARGLQDALDAAIAALPVPKLMSYQLADGRTTVRFARPAHGLLALHGDAVVNVQALGLSAGRITHGHRFQGVADIEIARAEAYEEALAAHGRVIASFAERRAAIERRLREAARELGAALGPEPEFAALLEEVTALVEWPAVYAGTFDPAFLEVPHECLTLTMRKNQKYFPLFTPQGRLTERFLIVSNMALEDPGNIIRGNERVVRPRLADARFFFDTDRRTPLHERLPRLANIVYHHRLGSQLDRVNRLRALAACLATRIGADPGETDRAALLAKADLVTTMVGEFPELQGVMGRYYAGHDGEPPAVCEAIESHYWPRFAGDATPEGRVAVAVSLADKTASLAGLFGIGAQPSGEKDPFALRRQALGVVRILIERDLGVALPDLLSDAFAAFPPGMLERQAHAPLAEFIYERLRNHLREAGYSSIEIESVLCMNPERLNEVPRQLEAVRAFARLPEAKSLASANKRVANILRQAAARGESFALVRAEQLKEAPERELFEALRRASAQATPLLERRDYTGYLKAFSVLKSPVDAFFDQVMVMVEEPELRHNRIALLSDLRQEMNRVADLSKLDT
ncbi:MAG: glycine--tRNA ligase subunit beta [Burkholderiales bacterium]|nr:glycine--tRNA ligase subunit beta [Burkholderiales bacterium]